MKKAESEGMFKIKLPWSSLLLKEKLFNKDQFAVKRI